MKRIALLLLFLCTQVLFAQFTAADVKYFVGEGSQTAYLVVDFKDGTNDRSYAWGIRFEPEQAVNGVQMLQQIAAAEPAFDFQQSNGFLNMISFNSHLQESGSDWWSLWTSSTGATGFGASGWMSSSLINGRWYGASYGFSNPSMQPPANPIAAYSSQWFTNANITSWHGNGANKSVVVVDFGTDEEGMVNSFAIGLQYDGTLSGEAILIAVQSYINGFSFVMNNTDIATIALETNSETGIWNIFKGTNLSDWTTKTTLSEVVLSNNEWLGLSFGTRRPFTPQEMNGNLETPTNTKSSVVQLYPNPVHDKLYVSLETEFTDLRILDQNGRIIKQVKENTMDVSTLASGLYFLQINYGGTIQTEKFIKL